jgi:NTE family protein
MSRSRDMSWERAVSLGELVAPPIISRPCASCQLPAVTFMHDGVALSALRAIALTSICLAAAGIADAQQPSPNRRTVGVAFGGGSARGFAHVGVIRWFEEHRIPIDVVAGTSMGGLIGGGFASGMSSEELARLLADTDWTQMFGASSYRFKNIRRKQDARDYPSYFEFGLKSGFRFPPSLNNGQQVDLLLAGLMASYADLASFDDLPTRFRCVAVDLLSANQVVIDRGPLDKALRATMSLPGVFPPVELDGRLLVDGGAMNNVPADVARDMGADVVVAVDVSTPSDSTNANSMLGVVSNTIDAMMAASTRRGIAKADIVIKPELRGFGSLDWRRSQALADAGYQAAEAMKDRLLPLALDPDDWRRYTDARNARRQTAIAQPLTLVVEGATRGDERRIRRVIERRLGQPLDLAALKLDIDTLSGLDVYQTIEWDLQERDGRRALVIRATPKSYAPPFVMLAPTLQNTTSEDFTFQLAGRYLAYDVLTPRSEARIDASLGSTPGLGAEFLQHLGASPLFAAVSGVVRKERFNFVQDDVVIAQYTQNQLLGQLDVGIDLGNDSEFRVGVRSGHIDVGLHVGDPVLPSIDGLLTELRAVWRYDGQDSPMIPTSGRRTVAAFRHVLEAPDLPDDFESDRTSDGLNQIEIGASSFWSSSSTKNRMFLVFGLGSSFKNDPLPTDQFPLGLPFRLSAFDIGERRGDNYYAISGGYLRQIGRLPDFLGGPIFAAAWLENGSAFNARDIEVSTHTGLGLVLETAIGPALASMSLGFDGHYRFYLAIGRLFP